MELAFALLCTISGAYVFGGGWVNAVVPDAYMDEVFHVPQAQAFCDGRWSEWDPMITTFPGMYFVSVALSKGAQRLGMNWGCSIPELRASSVMSAILCVGVMMWVKIRRDRAIDWGVLWPIVIAALWPPLSLSSFLYYTDAPALLWILLCYACSLGRRGSLPPSWQLWISAAIGVVAIGMRQTNAVWVAFVAADVLGRARGESNGGVLGLLQWMVSHWRKVLVLVGGYGVVLGWFVWFVIQNGGVVMGDKERHVPVLHFAQLGYVSGVLGVVALPYVPSIRVHWVMLGVLVIFMACCIEYGTHAHPFVTDDNRHYIFYLWRRVIAPLGPILAPVYAVGAYFSASTLLLSSPPSTLFAFCVAIFLSLVPTALPEPRYFTPAVVFFLLLIPGRRSNLVLATTLTLAVALASIICVLVFLFRPFRWHDGSVARFLF